MAAAVSSSWPDRIRRPQQQPSVRLERRQPMAQGVDLRRRRGAHHSADDDVKQSARAINAKMIDRLRQQGDRTALSMRGSTYPIVWAADGVIS
jgi:hypothetical protein